MATDQQALDLLTALADAHDKTSAAVIAQGLTAKALADAQAADQTAQADIKSGQADEDAKLNALVAYLQQTYGQHAAPMIGALRTHFRKRAEAVAAGGQRALDFTGALKLLPLLIQFLEVLESMAGQIGTPAPQRATKSRP